MKDAAKVETANTATAIEKVADFLASGLPAESEPSGAGVASAFARCDTATPRAAASHFIIGKRVTVLFAKRASHIFWAFGAAVIFGALVVVAGRNLAAAKAAKPIDRFRVLDSHAPVPSD